MNYLKGTPAHCHTNRYTTTPDRYTVLVNATRSQWDSPGSLRNRGGFWRKCVGTGTLKHSAKALTCPLCNTEDFLADE